MTIFFVKKKMIFAIQLYDPPLQQEGYIHLPEKENLPLPEEWGPSSSRSKITLSYGSRGNESFLPEGYFRGSYASRRKPSSSSRRNVFLL
jgi:hypothetical protein